MVSGKMRTLWRLMEGQRLRYAAAVVALVLSALFAAIQPLIFSRTIDFIIGNKPLSAPEPVRQFIEWIGGRETLVGHLWLAAMAAVAVNAISGLFSYLKGRWSAQAAEAIARRIRDQLFDRLQRLPCRYHDTHRSGDLVQRCTSDVETVRTFLAGEVVEIGRMLILLAIIVPIMLHEDMRMGLLSTMVVPVIITFAVIFFMRIRSTFQAQDEAEGRMTALLQENLTGIRVVRAFARQEYESAKFAKGNAEYRDRWYKLMKLFSWYWPTSDLMCIGQEGVVLLAGCWFVMHGMSVGTLYAMMAYLRMFIWPVRHAARLLADLGKCQVSLGRIQEILDAPAEDAADAVRVSDTPTQTPRTSRRDAKRVSDTPSPASPSGAELPPAEGRIEFRNLSFSHNADAAVLREVSFTVEPGSTVAILGPSGSGKSTLINLLLRLYDYDQGEILLDGVELRQLPRQHVRGQIGVVLQEPFLFSKTVRDNIKLGHAAAADEQVIEAATLAAVDENIRGFESGYDTVVGERGITLSGGQRQRVALARAALRDPPVLILDDALSAVDTRTEAAILAALRGRRGKRTTLVIAHRLTTLMNADRIVVIEDGRVAAIGTHAELLAAEGLYSRLWRIQSFLEEDLTREMQAAADGAPA